MNTCANTSTGSSLNSSMDSSMARRSPWARDGGFSLVELMIALTILAIGVLAVATLFDNSYKAGASARNMNNANRLAQTYMEQVLSVGYGKVLEDYMTGTRNFDVAAGIRSNSEEETISIGGRGALTYVVTLRVDEDMLINDVGVSFVVDKILVTVVWTDGVSRMDLSGLDSRVIKTDDHNRYIQYETYL